MIGTEKITVSLSLEGQNFDVGELVLSHRNIYFKYTPGFLSKGLNISPIRLPYTNNIVSAEYEPFDGLFGVFNDSLPDGWGRLLLDRTLTSKGINIADITPLDRLAYVGSGGMGGLVYKPEIEPGKIDLSGPELDIIALEISQVLEGTSPEIIEKLFIIGGSSGGARPKIFIGYNSQTGKLRHGVGSLPEGYDEHLMFMPITGTTTVKIFHF
jgi:serine/threonine-protein kinase HipA